MNEYILLVWTKEYSSASIALFDLGTNATRFSKLVMIRKNDCPNISFRSNKLNFIILQPIVKAYSYQHFINIKNF